LPPALTPALAVDYVRELSADVREVLVFGADGELLAGPAATAPATTAARALLDAAGAAAEIEAVTRQGVVCVVRSAGRAVVAVCGRFALPGVVREDLRAALAALDGAVSPDDLATRPGPPDRALETAAGALISAVQRQSLK
jgi:hypothetical protein